MWHEARKQEKKLRDVMINYQKRAERRKQHYEKMRGDPTQLIRLHGTSCKLHLDPTRKDEYSTMIPWQGDETNMISRYDVRIHMDLIPDYSKLPSHEPSSEETKEEARCNYERYRSIVYSSFKHVGEKEVLEAIDVEEMYPTSKKSKDKHKSQAKAAIAYKYGEEGGSEDEEQQARNDEELLAAYLGEEVEEEKVFSSESEYEVDMDIDEYQSSQVDKINWIALDYGIAGGAFSKYLRAEKSQMEERKMARIADMEKSTLTGKKGRRERRNLKEQKLQARLPTPPSYAHRGSPTYEPYSPEDKDRDSSSRSSSPEAVGKVEYITEFGGEPDSSVPTPSHSGRQDSRGREETRGRGSYRSHPSSLSSSLSHSPSRRHAYRSSRHRRSRSRSRDREHRYRPHRRSDRSRSRERRERQRWSSRSRSRSRERLHSRRSRSRSPRSHSRRSRSPKSNSWRSHSHSRKSDSPSPRSQSRRSRSRSKSRSKSRSRSPQEKASSTKKVPTIPQAPKTKDKSKMTPAEKLKKRMQAQLSKQYKIDKKAQRLKEEQKEAERVEREEDLRDQMRRMRGSDYRGRSRSRSHSPPIQYNDYY